MLFKSLGMALLIATAAVTGASAANFTGSTHLPSTSKMREGQPTMAPLAFLIFCTRYASECNEDGRASQVAMTPDTYAQMVEVNARINRKIGPNARKGGMDWSLDTRFGNCNDYAIQKRNALHARGFPMSALSLTVAITPGGQGHLILSVRTDRGDFILDNLVSRVKPWSETRYTLLKRQSASNPMNWVTIESTTELADNSY